MKSFSWLLVLSVVLVGCNEGFKYNNPKTVNKLGTTPSPAPYNPSPSPSPSPSPAPAPAPTPTPTPTPNNPPPPPPNEEGTVDAISNANPGMINDCNGIPIVNQFLLTVVRTLQQRDGRWGFMKKEGPFRIPRDILAYRWSNEGEGTHKFFVIDFVSSGCNNWPGAPEYADPMPNAGVWWNVLNTEDGIAGNGTWSFDP